MTSAAAALAGQCVFAITHDGLSLKRSLLCCVLKTRSSPPLAKILAWPIQLSRSIRPLNAPASSTQAISFVAPGCDLVEVVDAQLVQRAVPAWGRRHLISLRSSAPCGGAAPPQSRAFAIDCRGGAWPRWSWTRSWVCALGALLALSGARRTAPLPLSGAVLGWRASDCPIAWACAGGLSARLTAAGSLRPQQAPARASRPGAGEAVSGDKAA